MSCRRVEDSGPQGGPSEAVKDMILNMTQFTKASTDLVMQMNDRLAKTTELSKSQTGVASPDTDKDSLINGFFTCNTSGKCCGQSCAPCLFYEDKDILNEYIQDYSKSAKYKRKGPAKMDENGEYECRCDEFRKYIKKKQNRSETECACDDMENEDDDLVDEDECGCIAADIGVAGKKEDKIFEVKKKLDTYIKKARKYRKEYLELTGKVDETKAEVDPSEANKIKLKNVSQRLIGNGPTPQVEGAKCCGRYS